MRTTTASLLAVAAVTAALAPSVAQGAAPKAGVYAGTHATGKVSFKLGALSRRVVRVSGTAKLTCPDGTTRADAWDIPVFGPKTTAGRFTFRGEQMVLTARFGKGGRVTGTLDRDVDGCKVTGVAFTAKRR